MQNTREWVEGDERNFAQGVKLMLPEICAASEKVNYGAVIRNNERVVMMKKPVGRTIAMDRNRGES